MINRSRFCLNRMICPHLDIKKFFQLTVDLGLNKIELRNDLPGSRIIDNYSIEQINDFSKEYHIKILTINALQKFNLPTSFTKTIKELKKLINISKTIGCIAIVLCPNNDVNDKRSSQQIFKDTVVALKLFSPLFLDNGLLGYIEPLGFKESSIRSLIIAMKAIQESDCPNYKIVYDSFHHFIGPDTFEMLKNSYDISYTGLLHLSGVENNLPINQLSDDDRVLITEKDRLKNREQLKILLELGYLGEISFEPFAKKIQNMKIKDIKNTINQSIDYLMK